MSERANEPATPLIPDTCSRCHGWGWWVDDAAQRRGDKFFFYCSCSAGAQAKFEDEGGD
jgi:hypothetical protein